MYHVKILFTGEIENKRNMRKIYIIKISKPQIKRACSIKNS